MVDASIVLISLPVLTYYAGLAVNYYTKEELAKWGKSIKLVLTYIPILILIASSMIITVVNPVYALFASTISILVFVLIPKQFLNKNDGWLSSALSGIIIGISLNNYALIIALCAYYYFKANYDFYSKDKKLFSKRLMENVLYLLTGAVIVLLGVPEFLPLGVFGLLILRLRLR
ncbi:Uncharacterised protein [Candidatus Tiddalikarchaeum anstoanum]|nr:Uncharacterised protein [Candidatus Tiddalikarchaeum anstoanum]